MEIRTRPFSTLVDATLERLASGPTSAEVLVDELKHVMPQVDDPVGFLEELLDSRSGICWQPNRFYRPDVLFTGTTFTKVITGDEIETGRLNLHDLPSLLCLQDEGLLDSNYQVHRSGRLPGQLITLLSGPKGWLSHCRSGELCGVEYNDATLQITATPAPCTEQRLSELAASLGAAITDLGGTGDLEAVLSAAMLSEPAKWKGVVPPFDSLREAAGLGRRGDRITDETLGGATQTDALATYGLRMIHSLGEEEHSVLVALSKAVAGVEEHGLTELDRSRSGSTVGADIAAMLAHGQVAAAGYDLLRLTCQWDVDRIRTFAEALETRSRSDELSGVLYLLARCDLHDGALDATERRLHEARRADPEHGPTSAQLGWLAFYRSRFAEALRLLEFSAELDVELGELLEDLAQPSYGNVGRNERCPCGSGRKFKQCHASATALAPLADRAEVLMRKAGHSGAQRWPEALESDGSSTWDADDSRRDRAMDLLGEAGLAYDTHMFEDGAFARFIELRAELLPADELAMGRTWIETPRTVLEVVDFDPADDRIAARDLVRGNDIEIVLTSAPEWMDDATYLIARPLPVGDGWIMFDSALKIEDAEVEAAVELLGADGTSGLALAEGLLTKRSSNRSRVVCSGVLRSPDADSVAAWIETEFEARQPDGSDTLMGAGGGSVVTRRHDTVTVFARSIEEYESLVASIEQAGGPAERLTERGVEVGVLLEEAMLLHPDADEDEIRHTLRERLLTHIELEDA